jgi:hypothetical protein
MRVAQSIGFGVQGSRSLSVCTEGGGGWASADAQGCEVPRCGAAPSPAIVGSSTRSGQCSAVSESSALYTVGVVHCVIRGSSPRGSILDVHHIRRGGKHQGAGQQEGWLQSRGSAMDRSAHLWAKVVRWRERRCVWWRERPRAWSVETARAWSPTERAADARSRQWRLLWSELWRR